MLCARHATALTRLEQFGTTVSWILDGELVHQLENYARHAKIGDDVAEISKLTACYEIVNMPLPL